MKRKNGGPEDEENGEDKRFKQSNGHISSPDNRGKHLVLTSLSFTYNTNTKYFCIKGGGVKSCQLLVSGTLPIFLDRIKFPFVW